MNEEFSNITGFTLDLLIGFAVSVGIGFLLGLERQFAKEVKEKSKQFAGIRTFTLVSIFGFISAFLSEHLTTWLFPIAFVCLAAFVIMSYMKLAVDTDSRGATSEFALIITFLLGGLVFLKFILFSLIIMVTVLLLLTFKPKLHSFVKKLNRHELLAIIIFVVMSALVIPFLPDTNFGPYELWNLKEIWKMVVLVSGMSLIGYMIAKIMGNKGTIMAGIIGGLVSSTSISLTFSRRSKESTGNMSPVYFAIGIIAACTVMFPRILLEVYIINKALALHLWVPVILLVIAGICATVFIFTRRKGENTTADIPLKNPLDFGTAIKFALLFAAIQWLVKYSSETFGVNGTYIAGALSGITDVDAITLSMAKMSKASGNFSVAIHTIMLAVLSNTFVKFLIILMIGSRELKKLAAIGFAAIFITGLAYFIFTLL